MSLPARVFIVITTLVLAYLAIYLGDAVSLRIVANIQLPQNDQGSVIPALAYLLSVALAIVGLTYAAIWAIRVQKEYVDAVTHLRCIISGAASFLCIAFCFGVTSSPFADWGPWPWQWYQSRMLFFLAASFVPLCWEICLIVGDLKKSRKGNVIPWRRRGLQ